MMQLVGRGVVVAAIMALLSMPAWAAESHSININTATAAELSTLKGIGDAKAQAIVTHREKNGAFKSVEDLKAVSGIGDKLVEQLRPQVTLGSSEKNEPVKNEPVKKQ